MAEIRVKTGIEMLDDLIGGGFIKGRSYLIAGEPGTGKTLFSLQYVLNGAKLGEPGIYITIDEKPEHLISDADSMGWPLKEYLDRGTLQILDVSSYFSATRLGKVGKIEVERIIDDLGGYVRKLGAKRLVIDPIAPLITKAEAVSEIQEYIRKLIFGIEESTECTTLFTSNVPVGTPKLSQYGIEEFIVSGILLLKLIKPEKKYIRTLFVRKMRGTQTELSEYSFDIVKERGIVLRSPV